MLSPPVPGIRSLDSVQLRTALGTVRTLRQGRMHVGDQFRYRSAIGETGTFSAHLAVFREAFAVTAFVAESVELL